MTHTPAPWFCSPLTTRDGYRINDPEGHCVAETDGRSGDGEEEANAHLIAAAPNVLAALKATDRLLGDIRATGRRPTFAELNTLWEWVRAVIAKAEGKP